MLVVVGLALALRLADELPGMLTGVARGVRHVATIEDVARDSGIALPQPKYFPDAIQWPPSEILLFAGTSASAWFPHQGDRAPWLIIAASLGDGPVPPQVLPSVVVRQSEPFAVGGVPGTAERVQDAGGAVWHQIRWTAERQSLVVRYRGTLEALMTLVQSTDRRGR